MLAHASEIPLSKGSFMAVSMSTQYASANPSGNIRVAELLHCVQCKPFRSLDYQTDCHAMPGYKIDVELL